MALDPLARAGLAAMLAEQPGCRVVGHAEGAEGVWARVEGHHADVLLWDLGWNPESALEDLQDLGETGLPILALLPDPAQAPVVWSAGARGLLLREVNGPTLFAALRAVVEGLIVLGPELSASAPAGGNRQRGSLLEELTSREMEVLQLLAEGLPNKGIAQRLSISDHTVKFHVNAIMGKLGAQSRTEAVIRATRYGLILL